MCAFLRRVNKKKPHRRTGGNYFACFRAPSASECSGIPLANMTQRRIPNDSGAAEIMRKPKMLVFFAIVSILMLTVLFLTSGQLKARAVGPKPEHLLFQDNFQRANSNWVGGGWR